MNRQVLIAILLAAIAATLTYYYISEKEEAIKADVTPINVLIAKNPIARGGRITLSKLAIVEIPGAYVMPGAISGRTRNDVKKLLKKYQAQFAVVAIAKGEQILPNKLSALVPGFSGAVKQGFRITSFAFPLAAAVGGHIKSGNRVDVIGTFKHQFKNQKRTTSVVLVQNVLVTSVGEQTIISQTTSGKAPKNLSAQGQIVVSMSLTPEDALRLSLAEQEGNLKLLLRALIDENIVKLRDQHLGTLLGPLMRVQKEEIEPVKKRVRIIKGLRKKKY